MPVGEGEYSVPLKGFDFDNRRVSEARFINRWPVASQIPSTEPHLLTGTLFRHLIQSASHPRLDGFLQLRQHKR